MVHASAAPARGAALLSGAGLEVGDVVCLHVERRGTLGVGLADVGCHGGGSASAAVAAACQDGGGKAEEEGELHGCELNVWGP